MGFNSRASINVDKNTAFKYAWSFENGNSTQTTTTNKSHWNLGGDVTFSLPFSLIHKIKLSGDYASESVSTQTTRQHIQKDLMYT